MIVKEEIHFCVNCTMYTKTEEKQNQDQSLAIWARQHCLPASARTETTFAGFTRMCFNAKYSMQTHSVQWIHTCSHWFWTRIHRKFARGIFVDGKGWCLAVVVDECLVHVACTCLIRITYIASFNSVPLIIKRAM